ncbi:hypothetical protein C1645_827250 [Glomus cerebriforme]|uniref:F-box domain-containing protein n=1 Tax=Glomus cerebriforme TaxID=658196 RepID=A0A397SUV4_9GLOM|nr:hypothetical protein C1645_827250 [Glomus cerebriforme]
MACSKIFSGDLPELLNNIIQYFRNDFSTLRSCILVNRLWCRLTIPLLWKNPFSLLIPKNYHYIEIFLYNLSEEDKTQFNEIGINKNIFPTNTLFNYPSFIKCLKITEVVYSIKRRVETFKTSALQEQEKSSSHSTRIIDQNFVQIKKLFFKSLFKIFIENKANLHTFEVEMFIRDDYIDAFELISQNPKFICNIRNLKLIGNLSRNYHFLKFLYNCNSISSLHFHFSYIHSNNYMLIENNLSKLIKSQHNLKTILLNENILPLNDLLLSLKNSNCSNTLRTIIFYHDKLKPTVNLKEVFEQLNVLESVHFLGCDLNHDFIQQIINITKPFKLKSLFMNEILQIESLQLLLQKSGDYLENFGFDYLTNSNELKQQVLELVMKYCRNIKFLDIYSNLDKQNIYSIFNIIKNAQQNLNYLSLSLHSYQMHHNIIELSSIILLNLGQILPFKLDYLHLHFVVKSSYLEIFLKNSQNTFIKKLLIHNRIEDQYEDIVNILPCIKKYIMKKKRVEYLAILDFDDLFYLKDEVKEFESYNIQVKNYDDSYIEFSDFVKENYY